MIPQSINTHKVYQSLLRLVQYQYSVRFQMYVSISQIPLENFEFPGGGNTKTGGIILIFIPVGQNHLEHVGTYHLKDDVSSMSPVQLISLNDSHSPLNDLHIPLNDEDILYTTSGYSFPRENLSHLTKIFVLSESIRLRRKVFEIKQFDHCDKVVL